MRGRWLVRALALAGLIAGLGTAGAQHTTAQSLTEVLTPLEQVRGPEQTFLTFPEWYLVHSPAEYASFLAHAERPSAFPLFSHIGQFWQSYAAIEREIRPYPFNGGYHLMVMVIGWSTTVEYGLKGVYEHTIGRLAEATRSAAPVPEEALAAEFAQAYVDFIRVEPWYKFDFWRPLTALWSEVPLTGPNLVRRWERRFALTSELLVKEGYARLIKLGTQSIYDAPKPVTAVVLSRLPTADLDKHPDFRVIGAPRADGAVLATVPRYEAFTAYAQWLAGQGIDFVEIAGNRSDVVVSAWITGEGSHGDARVLFEQPILTRPGTQRLVLAVPVARLAAELRRWMSAGAAVSIEHVYDF